MLAVALAVLVAGCAGPGVTVVSRERAATTSGTDAGSRAVDDVCVAASAAIETLEELAGQTSAAELQDALTPAIGELRETATQMPVDVREQVETMPVLLTLRRDAGDEARAAAAATGDAEIAQVIDELVVGLGQLMFSPAAFLSIAPGIVERCPETQRILDRAWFDVDPTAHLRELRDRLRELGAGALADGFVPQGVLDVTDRDMTVALSGLQDEYVRCARARGAFTYGDDHGCDVLQDACDARNLLACNDLYWVSAPGSDYESFAASCGRRTSFGAAGFGGFCEELG